MTLARKGIHEVLNYSHRVKSNSMARGRTESRQQAGSKKEAIEVPSTSHCGLSPRGSGSSKGKRRPRAGKELASPDGRQAVTEVIESTSTFTWLYFENLNFTNVRGRRAPRSGTALGTLSICMALLMGLFWVVGNLCCACWGPC